MDGNNGSRIFVPLWGKAKINLTEGDFGVLDANGTDTDGATFSLPNPDPDADGVTEYSVYARALGTPGGSSTTTTCATDPTDGEEVCSTESMVLVREAKRSTFDNVSRELLYVYADYDGDGDLDLVPLFDDRLEDYFWDYDNKGLRIAQLRFYEHVDRRQLIRPKAWWSGASTGGRAPLHRTRPCSALDVGELLGDLPAAEPEQVDAPDVSG